MQTLPILLLSSSPTADTPPPPQLTTSINQLRSFSTALSAFINHHDELHTHINFINSSIDSIFPRHLLHTANPSLLKQVRLLESFSDRRINDLPDVIVLEKNPRESVSGTRSYEYETTPDSTYLLHNNYGGTDVLDNKLEVVDVCENRVEIYVSNNNNKLEDVDVSKISEGIDVCENRVEIDVSNNNNNKLEDVDVSKNAKGIDVSENHVEIDTSNDRLEAVGNNCEEIDVFENNMEIDVSNNKLEVVDVPNNCEEIDVCKNSMETDTLNNKLEVVDVSKNFEEIDVFKNSIEIGNSNNKLEVVDVSMNCEEIDVFKNPVELDVLNNFEVVGVLKNSKGFDVSKNPVETDTSNNKPEVVDVSNNSEEIDVSKSPVETNTSNNKLEVVDVSENHVEIDTLKTFDSTDLLHNYGGIDASNKLEVVNVSKSFEEIDVLMKKSDEIVTETFGDQTTGVVPEAIVSEQNLNGMATNGEQSHGQVRTPESLEEIDVCNKIEQNNILRKPEQTDTLSKHKRPGTRKKDTETETLNKFARKMQFLCENMNSKGMRWHVMEHLSETFDLREEIAKALKLAKDPAKLVLNCTGMFFEQDSSAFCKESGSGQNKENRRLASVLILECFVMISGDDGIEIAKKDHERAAKYAVIWRKRMIREGGVGHTDDVDARGLLLLISGFGIQDDVFKIQDIVDLIRASNVKGISTALRHSVFLIPKIPEVINLMVKNNLETEAVDMAYTFGLKKLEVVDVSKNCEGIDVSKNPVEIDTSNDKLEVVGVSKSCEESDVSENPVEVDALKKPVETVPETYCDHITPAVQETIVSKQDPDRMATNCEQSHENAPKKPAVIDISKMPEQTDILNKLEKIDILKKPEQIDACKNPEEPVVLKKWRKRKKTCKKPEETVPETSCDQTTPAVPEAIVSEQNPNRMATNPEQSHENVLKKPVVIDISKKPEQTDILKKHEEIDVLKTPEQTDVCKNPEQPVVTKKRKKREKTGILKKAEANETSEKSVVSVLRSFCKNMSHKKLRRHVATHFAEMINLREEIAKALKLAKDPAKLVLSSIGRFFVQSSGTYWKLHHEENLGRMAAVLILECFVMISSGGIEIAKSDQENAAQVAVDWKKRMIREGGPKPTDEVDARGLLLLISGFGIQDHVFKIPEIMDLIRASNVKGISTALCRSAFLIQKVPWVVCLMVKSNLEVEAVDIAYTFGLEDVCHPQDILMEYLDNKIKDFQNSSPFQMLEAVEQHLFDLKSVKQCLESHNIDPSTLLPNLKINEKIHNLEKEVNKWKLIQKRKSLQNLIQQEAKRACFGHESMPRQHRPVDYDGMNEVNRSTHTSTSHFNSDQNPETDTSKKPEVVEISKNPVEIYTFEEIDSSKKHAETDNSKMPEETVPETYYDETITTVSKAIVSEQNPSRMAGSHEQNHENARTPETLDEIDVSKKPEQTDILNEHELTNTCKNTEVTVVFKKPEELDTPMIPEEIDTMKKHEKTGTCKNAKETEALKKSKETEASKKPKETKGSKKPKETKALKKSKETETSKKPKETEASKKPKETEASKKPKETEALKKPKETDASKKPKETEASKKPKETKASKKPKETEASKKLMETEASKKPKEMKASKKPKSKETEASKKSTETEASKKSKETEASKKYKETEASKKSKETEASKKSKETEASKKSVISALESLCQSMSSKEMKWHVAAHFSEMINLRKQIAKTLKLAEDPAKLVLDSIGEFFVQDRKTFCQDAQKLGRKAAVLILECFVMISSDDIEVTKPDQEYAAQAAVDWKKRMVREGGLRHMDEVDARGLLLLISGFGIQDHVFKIRDILDLIRASNVKGISTALRRSVFLVPKIPEVIDLMVKNNLEIEAADVAYTFGLEDKRHPLIILATFLRNHIRNIQSGSFSQKLEEMKQQLFDLKAVKRCLESHNIDPSLHLPEFKINEKIQNLQNELNEAKFIQKRKSLEGPIHQEAKRACFGHESMPRNQSPVDHYGLNRRYQSPHLSTGYFDSDQDLLNRYISNYSPSSVYNTPAMRETVISPVPNGSYDHMHHSANVQPYGSNRPWGRGPPELFPEFHQSGGFPGRRGPSSDLYGFADIVEKKCMR